MTCHASGGLWKASRRGFTLIELILVMAMLLVVLSLAAPSLGRFFRGRDLELEVRRFLALTRYGQSRAVAEGVPMILWLDEKQRRYGLEEEFSYLDEDDKAVEFEVDADVKMEVAPLVRLANSELDLPRSLPAPRVGSHRRTEMRSVVMVRFAPTGFLTDSSPQWVAFRSKREEDAQRALWVAQSRSRLCYEIWTNEPPILR
jgi:type II secretion system protein H